MDKDLAKERTSEDNFELLTKPQAKTHWISMGFCYIYADSLHCWKTYKQLNPYIWKIIKGIGIKQTVIAIKNDIIVVLY